MICRDYDDQFGYRILQGDALRMETISNTPVAIRRRQCGHNWFEDLNHVNADATDETKIVTTKFVLGFCQGQLRFCLLVRT